MPCIGAYVTHASNAPCPLETPHVAGTETARKRPRAAKATVHGRRKRAPSTPSPHMELLDAQLRDDPAAVRVRVPRQLAAALDGSVDRQSVERAPLAWCLVALQYNKATVAKVFKLLCASGRVAQCGALVAAAAHQPEEVTVRKSLMLLLRACCVQAHGFALGSGSGWEWGEGILSDAAAAGLLRAGARGGRGRAARRRRHRRRHPGRWWWWRRWWRRGGGASHRVCGGAAALARPGALLLTYSG